MDIRQIKAFVTVANLNNFTHAADQLGYAQSSITSQIQLLEKELGVQLFERLAKKITLTPEGVDFLVYSKQLLSLWEKAKGSVTTSEVPHGILNIGTVESICTTKLPKFLEEYNRHYPDVEFNIQLGTTMELETMLKENQIDVAIMLDQKISHPELVVQQQQHKPLALLVSPCHPLIYAKQVRPKDIAMYPILLPEHSCCSVRLFQKIMDDANETYKTMLTGGNIQTLTQFAAHSLGIALLPLFAVTEELETKKLAKLNWEGMTLEVFIQIVIHKDKWISAALDAFLKMSKAMEW